MRTSLSHPLQIATVKAPGFSGAIGITFCPGKKQPNAATGAWDRDLALDLDAISAWGAATIITLIEPQELIELGVPTLGKEIEALGITWLHLPITDVATPDHRFETGFLRHGAVLRDSLQRGHNILVHCKGGLGRAGTVAALLLVELGIPAATAIRSVRRARPGAIETQAQEEYVRAWSSKRSSSP